MKTLFTIAAVAGVLAFDPSFAFAQSDVTVHPRVRHAPRPPRESWNDGAYSNIWRDELTIPAGYNYSEVVGSYGARPANGNGAFPMLPSQPVYAPSDQGFPMRGMSSSLLHGN